MAKLSSVKGLGERVSQLIVRSHELCHKLLTHNFFLDKMTINFDVFGSLMISWIVGDMNCLIVTEKFQRSLYAKPKLLKKSLNPN